jgi:exonuclease III
LNIISSNIRGLNGRTKQTILRSSILTYNQDILLLLLQETKCSGTVAKTLLFKSWRNKISMFIDSKGAVRSLAILWNPIVIILEDFYSTK